MYTVDIVIEGVAPILFNRMTDSDRAVLEGEKPGGGKKSKAVRQAEAMERCYRDERGLYLPSWNVKRCIIEGSNKAGLKEGRASLGQFLMAEMFLTEDPAFGKAEPDFLHENLGRVPARTGAAAIIRRPALSVGWRLPFTINVFEDRRATDSIAAAIETAGTKVGLGSWRPEFGRFVLKEFAHSTA